MWRENTTPLAPVMAGSETAEKESGMGIKTKPASAESRNRLKNSAQLGGSTGPPCSSRRSRANKERETGWQSAAACRLVAGAIAMPTSAVLTRTLLGRDRAVSVNDTVSLKSQQSRNQYINRWKRQWC